MWATQSVVQAVVEFVDNSLELSIKIHNCAYPQPRIYYFLAGMDLEFAVLGCLWENNAIGVYQGNELLPPVAPLSGVFQR